MSFACFSCGRFWRIENMSGRLLVVFVPVSNGYIWKIEAKQPWDGVGKKEFHTVKSRVLPRLKLLLEGWSFCLARCSYGPLFATSVFLFRKSLLSWTWHFSQTPASTYRVLDFRACFVSIDQKNLPRGELFLYLKLRKVILSPDFIRSLRYF